MSISVCWIQHGGELRWAEQVASLLDDIGVHVRFVSTIAQFHEQYKKDGFESHFISEVFDWSDCRSQEELAALDMKYGPPGISAICESDLHLELLFGDRTEEKKQIIARAYRFWEEFFVTYRIEYLIMRDTASFATRTAYNISRTLGKPLAMILDLGPTNDTMTMHDMGEHQIWRGLVEAVSQGFQPLGLQQRSIAWRAVRDRTAETRGPVTLRPIPQLREVPSLILRSWLRERKCGKMDDPIGVAWERLSRQILLKRTWWKNAILKIFPYDNPVDGEKYVYFPLFFEKEWLSLVGPHFLSQNMIPLIREIALNLPEGYRLYVKEHPAVPGELSFSRLREVRQIPRVRIIAPLIPGQSLVLNSAATITLFGSSGWEAFLHRRPVLVLGETWYALSDLVYKPKNMSFLSSILWDAIRRGQTIYVEREQEWLWFIYQAINTSAPANVYNCTLPYFTGHSLENSKRLAAAIAKKIERDLREADMSHDSEGKGTHDE